MKREEVAPAASGCCEAQRAVSLERIYHYLDGELDQEALSAIGKHLAECPGCMREYSIEAALKELVRRSCRDEQAPAGLRERIQRQILVERAAGHTRTTVVTRVGHESY